MRTHLITAFALVLFTGCSSTEEPVTGAVDSGDDGSVADTARSDGAADSGSDTTSATDSNVAQDTAVATDSAAANDVAPASDAASDTRTDGAASTDATPDTNTLCEDSFKPCSSVGTACPNNLTCYGSGASGFCAPSNPECGGFANTQCAGGRTCIRNGGSNGYCATDEEKACICKRADAGSNLEGC